MRWIAFLPLLLSASALFSADLGQRAIAFAHKASFEKEDSEGLYNDFMSERFKSEISLEDFVFAVEKDRTYPYITPFCIYFDSYVMGEDGMSASVRFVRAARLPGNYFRAEAVLENGDWYFYAFEDYISGAYLEKFERLNYSLDWYYDTDDFYIPPRAEGKEVAV